MSASLFANLKSFCSNIEDDAKNLRRTLDSGGKFCSEGLYYPSDDNVATLRQRVHLLDNTLQNIENSVLGNAESRLRQISVTEISEKISSLVEANERQLRSLEDVVFSSHSSRQGDYEWLDDARKHDDEEAIRRTYTDADGRIVASTPQPQSSDTKKVMLLSRGRGFSAEKVGPPSESDTDLRPSAARTLSSSHEGVEEVRVLTPTLAAWKLTKATQNLFQDPDNNNKAVSAGLLNTTKKAPNAIFAASGSKIPIAVRKLHQRDADHHQSILGSSYEEGDGGAAFGYSTGAKSPQYIGYEGSPPAFRTPDINGATLAAAGKNGLHLDPATPVTPVTPSVGTPFHAFKLASAGGGRRQIVSPTPAAFTAVRDTPSSLAVADGTAIYDANKTSDRPYPPQSQFSSSTADYTASNKFSSVSASTPQPIRSKAVDLAASASAPTPPSPFREVVDAGRSPLLMSKLLAPRIRKGSAAVSAAEVVDLNRNSGVSLIPLVADREWQTNAPSFLKMQLSSADLNSVLRVINDHMADVTNRSSRGGAGDYSAENAGSDVLLRLEEVESLVTSAGVPLAVDIKIVLLGLVHMKRMDIAASTHGVKVYKIKRI